MILPVRLEIPIIILQTDRRTLFISRPSYRPKGRDHVLPHVPGGVRPGRGRGGGAPQRVSGPGPALGVWRRRLWPGRIPGDDALVRPAVHLHVDQCGPVPGHQEASQVSRLGGWAVGCGRLWKGGARD